jgi:type IV pilus assembly protein PilM
MAEEEIPQAVRYQSQRLIPLSLKEATLDWQIIEGEPSSTEGLKILVVAMSNEIIDKYRSIADLSHLGLIGIEPEAFSLVRALIREEEGVAAILNIGAQSTSCNIAKNRTLEASYSLSISRRSLTQKIVQELNIDYDKALDLEKKYGIKGEGREGRIIYEILAPSIKSIPQQIKNAFEEFYQIDKRTIQKIILAGGTALLPGLREFLETSLQIKVEIANPFLGISYPSSLEEDLIKTAPILGVAVGLAKRNFLR